MRRRRSPTFWSDEQLAAQIRAAYLGEREYVPEADGEIQLAAVIFHQDRALLPRRMVRWADKKLDGFVSYAVYGVWWNDSLASSVRMGDEPFDTFRAYSGHHYEAEATEAAKRWLEQEGGERPRALSFGELPPFGQRMVYYVLRRGPSYFQ